MKKQITWLVIAIGSTFFTGCGMVSSSVYYTNGTECLNRGNFPRAVIELEKAVECDPSMARNHTNLASAYYGVGNFDKGWYHCRQAVRCPYKDGICTSRFIILCNDLIFKPGLNEKGTTWEEITSKLGTPDDILENENHEVIACTYGILMMFFQEGKVERVYLNEGH